MERKTNQACGYDLKAENSGQLLPNQRCIIPLQVKGRDINWPIGSFGKLEMRSSLANRFGLMVLGGVIDSDYKDIIKLIVYNSGSDLFTWEAGDRVCQIVFQYYANLGDEVEVKRIGGFGSTNKLSEEKDKDVQSQ